MRVVSLHGRCVVRGKLCVCHGRACVTGRTVRLESLFYEVMIVCVFADKPWFTESFGTQTLAQANMTLYNTTQCLRGFDARACDPYH